MRDTYRVPPPRKADKAKLAARAYPALALSWRRLLQRRRWSRCFKIIATPRLRSGLQKHSRKPTPLPVSPRAMGKPAH